MQLGSKHLAFLPSNCGGKTAQSVLSFGLAQIMFVLLLSSCSNTDVEQKCKEQAAIGLKQYQAREFQDAEITYSKAAELAKQSANALQYPLMLRELARTYAAEKKFEQAQMALQTACTYYEQLAQQPASTRFDHSLVDERMYETLATLAESYYSSGKLMDSKRVYARAIALGNKIVEPPTISGQVKEKYIELLRRTGDTSLADDMETKQEAAACTVDEFDVRLESAVKAMNQDKFSLAEKQFNTLAYAAQGFMGTRLRLGKVKVYVALFQLAHNYPLAAELSLREALSIISNIHEAFYETIFAYSLMGIAKELQGDTKSSAIWYDKACIQQPFLATEIFIPLKKAMNSFGNHKQAQIVGERVKAISQNPRYRHEPQLAIDYIMLARQRDILGDSAAGEALRLKALSHLEQESLRSRPGEMRGAYQLYRHWSLSGGSNSLAKRALTALYRMGRSTRESRAQLERLIERERLPQVAP